MWPRYPVVGATVVLAANVALIVGPLILPNWRHYWPLPQRVAVILLGLIGLDDSAQHALGWHTPLDALWKAGGRE